MEMAKVGRPLKSNETYGTTETADSNPAAKTADVVLAVDSKPRTPTDGDDPDSDDEDLVLTGYKNDPIGTLCVTLVFTTSVLWFLVYLLLVVDFYYDCELTGVDAMCLYGSYPLFGNFDKNGEFMFALWVIFLVWFGILLGTRTHLKNWFRQPCPLKEAQWVHVQAPTPESEVMSMFPSEPVKWVRELVKELQARGYLSSKSYHEETVPVQTIKQARSTKASASGSFKASHIAKPDADIEMSSGGSSHESVTFIEFRCTRFVMNTRGQFSAVSFSAGATNAAIHAAVKGLTSEEATRRLYAIGPNKIPFTADSILGAVMAEFSSFFYLYQLQIYSIWLWWSYLFVALAMLLVVVGSAAMNILIKRSNQLTIQAMTDYVTKARVKRDGRWEDSERDSTELVPGDVIRVRADWVLPCDLVIVSGMAVVDESGLTGESKPVRKASLPNTDDKFDPHAANRQTLFAGTKTLQVAPGTTAVVLATGTGTSKGSLVMHILFPTPMQFKYDEELPLAVLMLFIYGVVCFILVVWLLERNGSDSSWLVKFLYGVFTVSQVLSPLLPISLVVGQTMSARRLGLMGVFCVNPKRIAISGKIRVFCFDKTGTITRDGLDFIGAHVIGPRSSSSSSSSSPAAFRSGGALVGLDLQTYEDPTLVKALASCHAVTQLQGLGESKTSSEKGKELMKYVGPEVEVKMFVATGWELLESGDVPRVRDPRTGAYLDIVQRFEFDHRRMTMSVLVRDQANRIHVFTKGSAERVGALCSAQSLPADYDAVSKGFALSGCYVLSVATCDLGVMAADKLAALQKDRDAVEAKGTLTWLTLINFRNELKEDSAQAIESLKAGEVRPVMITGDNAQCGGYIARASKMVSSDAPILLAELPKGVPCTPHNVQWRPAGTEGFAAFDAHRTWTTQEVLDCADPCLRCCELAVTGKAFDALTGAPSIGAPGGRNLIAEQLLFRFRIFARMKPEGKVAVVQMFIDKGLIVGMCGDGGNDCGALRAAHAGIALSEAEASVVSPFTASTKSIQSAVDLCREGRGALATSFAGYKFLVTYGQLFSTVKLICLGLGVIMAQMDYIFLDAIAVMSLSYAMTLSHPLEKLGKRRPTSSLLGIETVGSLLGMQFFNLSFLWIGFSLVQADAEYVTWPVELSSAGSYWYLYDNWETTVLFCTFAAQFCTAAFLFTNGSHFRKNVFSNYLLIASYVMCMVCVSVVLLCDQNGFTELFHSSSQQFNVAGTEHPIWAAFQCCANATCYNSQESTCIVDDPVAYCAEDNRNGCEPSGPMSSQLRFELWAVLVCSCLVTAFWELVVINGPVADYIRRNYPTTRPVFDM